MNTLIQTTCRWLIMTGTLFTSLASAGNYAVSPLDVQFTQSSRSAVLTITNDDSQPLTLRVRAMRWTQNAAGQDDYQESQDLVFFPRRLDIQPGDKRIIRLGINSLSQQETAYRLFIDEVPQVQAGKSGSSKLAVLISFGIPVFVTPGEVTGGLAIKHANVDKGGKLALELENTGNSRVRISRLLNDKNDVVNDAISSRYIFPGIVKSYQLDSKLPLCGHNGEKLQLETDRGVSQIAISTEQGC